jgi:hypothetical protein
MNRPVAVGATIRNGQTGSVVVVGVTLQAQRGFAHGQKVRVRRTMGGVTSHAIFRDRGMLIGKWAAILRMATQTELIHVRRPQVVTGRSAMWIVAVGTTHLSFPEWMVIRQAHFSPLALVTTQASIIALPSRLHDCFAFRHKVLRRAYVARSRHVDHRPGVVPGFGSGGVNLMAINAADFVRSVRAGHPVLDFGILGMTAEAHPIRIRGGSVGEGNNLRNIPAALDVQAARTVTLLAFDALLRMKRVLVLLSYIRVARRARFRANRRGSRNLYIFRKRGDTVGCFFSCYG